MVGDLKVDLGHVALSWWDEVVSAVVDRYEVDDWRLETIGGGGVDALVLHDDGLYEQQRERVVPYPFELSRRTIEAHLHVLPRWV